MKSEDNLPAKGERSKYTTGYLILGISGIIFLALIVLILYGTLFGIREGIKQAVVKSGSEELQRRAEILDYQIPEILKDTYSYAQSLEDENQQLCDQVESMNEQLSNQESTASGTVASDVISSVSWTPEEELLHLFCAEESAGGGYMARELEDTLIYMAYKPALEPSQRNYEWEQYDRLEVDMYKRNGQWTNDKNEEVTVKLPENFESAEYWVCFYLRNDASKAQIGASGSVRETNGGTITLKSDEQSLTSGRLRFASGMWSSGAAKLSLENNQELTLQISPQNGTDFFSCTMCIAKHVPD